MSRQTPSCGKANEPSWRVLFGPKEIAKQAAACLPQNLPARGAVGVVIPAHSETFLGGGPATGERLYQKNTGEPRETASGLPRQIAWPVPWRDIPSRGQGRAAAGQGPVIPCYSPACGHFSPSSHALSAWGQPAAPLSEQADFSWQQLADLAALPAQQPLAQHSFPQHSAEQHSSVQPVVLQVPAWQQAASPVQHDPPEEQHCESFAQQASPALGWAVPALLVIV